MPSVVALRRWLVVVALLRLLSVYLGYMNVKRLSTNLFDTAADVGTAVTPLTGRTFAMWTATSSMLCLVCAKNPQNKAIYGATLMSFVLALLFFIGELFVFKTLTWKSALQPMTVAVISTLWLGAGYNYYTAYSTAEPSEEISSELLRKDN
mmetsp:Transcript_1822/g.5309  ORF Transcript_1822/g.5309 Transcript_1822/m.5309 type:complete len:151 (-) Transcript_1822:1111-1563(-)|eukprot:CAMPEP_0206146564 /NCGR_PEP_ID=MMETSP1473-20131121/30750_1 /ASSEMBLY_ACC=CAM_ASM_001109 /TAXON_ID=1461547 /ORGANISM="Stichococcus sp, Strain RCC1054" /LENGTH=150 /DNA_ID=CAMNT_0053543165 /DNA_START=205 /DNA_END=657 /DNA_ORIENTATION=-